jgi:hypothetical protein
MVMLVFPEGIGCDCENAWLWGFLVVMFLCQRVCFFVLFAVLTVLWFVNHNL